jgi:TnpA family transposase
VASRPKNGLAVALRELGRIERTLFTLDWLQNTELRRRVHVGLNKGDAKNALAKAVFFNRLGEMRDAASRTSVIGPAASTWWWLPSFFATQFTWNARFDV